MPPAMKLVDRKRGCRAQLCRSDHSASGELLRSLSSLKTNTMSERWPFGDSKPSNGSRPSPPRRLPSNLVECMR
ncbi:hypothetical protein Q1695_014088 [Nippostrongylus brasiliensis]|nr:hypothetical protein Q1695_014088 [Nippostrongylus brasiliensis]